jgi:hypothetical protein
MEHDAPFPEPDVVINKSLGRAYGAFCSVLHTLRCIFELEALVDFVFDGCGVAGRVSEAGGLTAGMPGIGAQCVGRARGGISWGEWLQAACGRVENPPDASSRLSRLWCVGWAYWLTW